MAKRKTAVTGRQEKTGADVEQMDVAYRTGDFLPLFLRRQFEKTAFWLFGTILATASGVAVIYAASLVLSGQADKLDSAGAWLAMPLILLAVFAGFAFYAVNANARVLLAFYRKGGGPVRLRISDAGIEVRSGLGIARTGWEEATRFEVRRAGFVVWKGTAVHGTAVPVVLPSRLMSEGQYARILAVASASLARIRAEAAVVSAAKQPVAAYTVPDASQATAQEDPQAVAKAPDYSESEYRFGDDWVPGGIRFTMDISERDRDGLTEYALVRPNSRRSLAVLGFAAAAMSAWLLMTYLNGEKGEVPTNLFFAILSFSMALLCLIAVIRPPLFMRIIARLPGNRKRKNSAVRHVLCVLSEGVMYAKTEGRVDKVALAAFHEIVHYRHWLFLFKDRKTAYIVPLRCLDETTRDSVFTLLGSRMTVNRKSNQ